MADRVIAPDVASKSLPELLAFKGRRAVITGGARGIGQAIAARLAEGGADVCIGDIDGEAARASADQLAKTAEGKMHGLRLDIADRQSVDDFVEAADEALSGLDIWINNAAILPANRLISTSDEEWAAVIDTNLSGPFYCCRAAALKMLSSEDRDGKVILNMSSLSGLRGRKDVAGYVSAKHGVSGMTKALALELAPEGIRVMALAPSIVDTAGMRERRETLKGDQLKAAEELDRKLIEAVPLGRQGVPDDIARAAVFCVSDMSAWMTGTIIPVDGGMAAS